MDSPWIAVGVAFVCTLAPNWLQAVGEGFFGRKRRVSGPGWTLSGMAIVLPALVSRLLRYSTWGRDELNTTLLLLAAVVGLMILWVYLTRRSVSFVGKGPLARGLMIQQQYRIGIFIVNAAGVVAFYGVVLFMLVFGDRVWAN